MTWSNKQFGVGDTLGGDHQPMVAQDQHIGAVTQARGNRPRERQTRPDVGDEGMPEPRQPHADQTLGLRRHRQGDGFHAVNMDDYLLRHQRMNGGLDRWPQT